MSENKNLHPESLMMSYGYKPEWSEGAIKSPIFQTSTFVFKSAEAGKSYFELAYGMRAPLPDEKQGLIYSRINNPDLEILENRLTLWDKAESAAVFESGMSAISTSLLELLEPGDFILVSSPLYGGTDHFIKKILPKWGIQSISFKAGQSPESIRSMVQAAGAQDKLKLIYIETPANPTNDLIDIGMMRDIADTYAKSGKEIFVLVDNTYMGPLWSHPFEHGADLVLYSCTKYIGGHSDVIAGACVGSFKLINRIKQMRTFLGSMAGPWTGWLLLRSLETLKARMDLQAENAKKVAAFLNAHPMVEKVYYLGNLTENDGATYVLFKKQYESAGAMISFDIRGGEKEAFKVLNALKLVKLAVSLGSTESLAEHPATMTHIDVEPVERMAFSITDKMIRLSVGLEHVDDIISDLQQALETAFNKS